MAQFRSGGGDVRIVFVFSEEIKTEIFRVITSVRHRMLKIQIMFRSYTRKSRRDAHRADERNNAETSYFGHHRFSSSRVYPAVIFNDMMTSACCTRNLLFARHTHTHTLH